MNYFAARLSQPVHIVIDISTRTLSLYQGEQLLHSYPVAIGKASTPTPLGQWTIVNKKILNDNSIFGSRWMGLSTPSYGIHGTNRPSSIGSAVSAGCIRMYNDDVEALYPLVPIGTSVSIVNGSQSSPGQSVYLVQQGDTLWKIAQKFQTTVAVLLQYNPEIHPQNLFIGQQIRLPQHK